MTTATAHALVQQMRRDLVAARAGDRAAARRYAALARLVTNRPRTTEHLFAIPRAAPQRSPAQTT